MITTMRRKARGDGAGRELVGVKGRVERGRGTGTGPKQSNNGEGIGKERLLWRSFFVVTGGGSR